MRGFRPSYFQAPDDLDEDHEHLKEENLLRYMKRVQAGLPLFEDDHVLVSRTFLGGVEQLPVM
jgi:hypothetical protein